MHLIVFKTNIPVPCLLDQESQKEEKFIRLEFIKRTAQAVLFSFLLLVFP